MKNIRIALVQDAERESKEAAFKALEQSIAQAAQNGAKIICTQELFLTEYFCWKQDPDFFELAYPLPCAMTDRFAALAKELDIAVDTRNNYI